MVDIFMHRDASARKSTQLTAFFTSAMIFASSLAVNSLRAKLAGHMLPSSRFATSLKPKVEYLVLNFCALWKKQTTLSSFAYAGIPYQVFGDRPGAASLMIVWSRSAMDRSGCGISVIFLEHGVFPVRLVCSGFQLAGTLLHCCAFKVRESLVRLLRNFFGGALNLSMSISFELFAGVS